MNPTGMRAYAAYVMATGGLTYDGKPLPNWSDLDTQRQAGWAAAELTPQIKPWWQSKTVWFNALGFVATCVAAAEMALPVLKGAYDGNTLFVLMAFVLPIGNAGLRFITQTAVGK